MSRVEHIGDATLYLGDARDVVPSLADRSVDFIFTDPPYGHNNNNGDLIHRWEAALGRLPCGIGARRRFVGIEVNERWFEMCVAKAHRLEAAIAEFRRRWLAGEPLGEDPWYKPPRENTDAAQNEAS